MPSRRRERVYPGASRNRQAGPRHKEKIRQTVAVAKEKTRNLYPGRGNGVTGKIKKLRSKRKKMAGKECGDRGRREGAAGLSDGNVENTGIDFIEGGTGT